MDGDSYVRLFNAAMASEKFPEYWKDYVGGMKMRGLHNADGSIMINEADTKTTADNAVSATGIV